jgi:predicted transcriptional regulator
MEGPENSMKQSVPDYDEPGDSLEQTVSPLARKLLELINKRGPTTVSQFKALRYNYSTFNPILQELVEKGFLRKDENPSVGGGRHYFHITNDGIAILVPNWQTMMIMEKMLATHYHNYQDLGILEDFEKYVSAQQKMQTGPTGQTPVSDNSAQKTELNPPSNIDPQAWRSILELASSEKTASQVCAVGGLYFLLHPDRLRRLILDLDRVVLREDAQRRSDAGLRERLYDRLLGVF